MANFIPAYREGLQEVLRGSGFGNWQQEKESEIRLSNFEQDTGRRDLTKRDRNQEISL